MHLANAEGDESLVHLDADALQVNGLTSSYLLVKTLSTVKLLTDPVPVVF